MTQRGLGVRRRNAGRSLRTLTALHELERRRLYRTHRAALSDRHVRGLLIATLTPRPRLLGWRLSRLRRLGRCRQLARDLINGLHGLLHVLDERELRRDRPPEEPRVVPLHEPEMPVLVFGMRLPERDLRKVLTAIVRMVVRLEHRMFALDLDQIGVLVRVERLQPGP